MQSENASEVFEVVNSHRCLSFANTIDRRFSDLRTFSYLCNRHLADTQAVQILCKDLHNVLTHIRDYRCQAFPFVG